MRRTYYSLCLLTSLSLLSLWVFSNDWPPHDTVVVFEKAFQLLLGVVCPLTSFVGALLIMLAICQEKKWCALCMGTVVSAIPWIVLQNGIYPPW